MPSCSSCERLQLKVVFEVFDEVHYKRMKNHFAKFADSLGKIASSHDTRVEGDKVKPNCLISVNIARDAENRSLAESQELTAIAPILRGILGASEQGERSKIFV